MKFSSIYKLQFSRISFDPRKGPSCNPKIEQEIWERKRVSLAPLPPMDKITEPFYNRRIQNKTCLFLEELTQLLIINLVEAT